MIFVRTFMSLSEMVESVPVIVTITLVILSPNSTHFVYVFQMTGIPSPRRANPHINNYSTLWVLCQSHRLLTQGCFAKISGIAISSLFEKDGMRPLRSRMPFYSQQKKRTNPLSGIDLCFLIFHYQSAFFNRDFLLIRKHTFQADLYHH